MNIYDTPEEKGKESLNELTKYLALVVAVGIVVLLVKMNK